MKKETESKRIGVHIWVNKKKQLHRLEGPAVEYDNGNKKYYIKNVEYTEEEFPDAVLLYLATKNIKEKKKHK